MVSAIAHYNLGVARAAEGRWEDAARHYRRALELRPDLEAARERLGPAPAGARSW